MRFGIVLLATAFITVGIPLAAADETAPDCEADQPWIGYARTDPVRTTYYEDLGGPAPINTCEGEHWDGQDSVSDTAGGSCSGAVSTDPSDLHVGVCGERDVNTNPGDDPLTPLGVRVSADSGDVALYGGVNIGFVGRAALHVDQGTAAIYLRDNTIGNVLATVVSAPRITQGHVAETDCDQSTYQAGAYAGDARCGRDNTAITIEHGLLA